jgi:hypothetical protein
MASSTFDSPSPEKESGERLIIPITYVRSPQQNSVLPILVTPKEFITAPLNHVKVLYHSTTFIN